MLNVLHNLRKTVALALGLGLIGWTVFPQATNAQDHLNETINGDSWVVMDAGTGEIILEKNMSKPQFPASITKIVTAILAIEERDWNEVVTVSAHAQNTEGSSMELRAGDQVSLKDLLYGIMLHSGNDGAAAIAEHLSGDEEAFSRKMTAFARSVGAKNTQFKNASGLPDDDHYTTALDMALIAKYAMKNEKFKELVGHKSYGWDARFWRKELMEHEKVEAEKSGIPWEGKPIVVNHNQFLGMYEGATGVKNGFTHEARYTLVGAAKKNGYELIAVVLKSEDAGTAYSDMEKLLDEGFKTERTPMETSSMDNQDEPASVANENNTTSARPAAIVSIPDIPVYLSVTIVIMVVSLAIFIWRQR